MSKPAHHTTIASKVAASLGAAPGTPELRQAVDGFNGMRVPRKPSIRGKLAKHRQSGWWATDNATGESLHVPGVAHNRWFDARALGVALLNDARIKRDPKAAVVHQDGVLMSWVEADVASVGHRGNAAQPRVRRDLQKGAAR